MGFQFELKEYRRKEEEEAEKKRQEELARLAALEPPPQDAPSSDRYKLFNTIMMNFNHF